MATLKEKLAKDIESGNLNLGSGDVAAFSTPASEVAPIDVKGDVEVSAEIPKNEMANAATPASPLLAPNTELVKVTVTEEDRNNFISAMITGKRFTTHHQLFNGKLSMVFRSRSQIESQAIIAQLTRELREGRLISDADYNSRLCCMLLAAGVEQLNDVAIQELAKPYLATVGTDGKAGQPGWIQQVEYWEGLDNGLVTAVFEAFRTFERRYWVMVAKAGEQNFWRLVGSTSV